MMDEKEYCKRCGIDVYPFSKKYSESVQDYFCVKCAERYDAEYLVKNSCSLCQRLLKKEETKVALPSKFLSKGPLQLADRIACAKCFNEKIAHKVKDRRTAEHNIDKIRSAIRRSFTRRMLTRPEPVVAPNV